jgi:preprotein translocase subunit SecF
MRRLRLVPDDTTIQFMRGRYAGLIVSAVLSIASVIMFFTPGLNYGIDFLGGVVVELRLPGPADNAALRDALESLHFGEVKLQQFGSPRDILIKLDVRAGSEDGRRTVQNVLSERFPGSEVRRVEVVGSKVSKELFADGLLATVLALVAILIYIWFRFEWQFGVGVVATLILDATKTIGFFALTRLQFDLNSLAAIMTSPSPSSSASSSARHPSFSSPRRFSCSSAKSACAQAWRTRPIGGWLRRRRAGQSQTGRIGRLINRPDRRRSASR